MRGVFIVSRIVGMFTRAVLVLLAFIVLLAGCDRTPAREPIGSIRRIFIMPTGSMAPTLKGGETLDVTPLPFEKLRVGHVAVFLAAWNDRPVVHRIVRREGGRFITAGDANWTARGHTRDPGYLTRDNYVGIVEVDERSRIRFVDGSQ